MCLEVGNKVEIYNTVEKVGFIEKVMFEPRFEGNELLAIQIPGETFP